MGLSDCIKCWETPCICGHDYMEWSEERIEKQRKMLKDVLMKKKGWNVLSEGYPERKNEIILIDKHNGEHHVYLSKVGQEWRSIFGGGLLVQGEYWKYKYKYDKDKDNE